MRPEWTAYFEGRYDVVNDCWIWNGTRNNKGYPTVGGRKLAHRKSWELANGQKIGTGMQIDHFKCFTPVCIRPDHLAPKTHAQNQQNRKGANRNNMSSGYRNVHPESGSSTWFVRLRKDGVIHRRSGFPDAESANRAAIALRKEIFG